MSHSFETAEKSYNFSSVNDAVLKTLELSQKSMSRVSDEYLPSTSSFNIRDNTCSTPIKSNHHPLNISITGSPVHSPPGPSPSPSPSTVVSLTKKRCSQVLESSEEEDDIMDTTMKTLRTKKIKNTKYDHALLVSSIKNIIDEMKKEGVEHLLRSKSGQVSIIQINRRLPNVFKGVSAGIIRELVKSFI